MTSARQCLQLALDIDTTGRDTVEQGMEVDCALDAAHSSPAGNGCYGRAAGRSLPSRL